MTTTGAAKDNLMSTLVWDRYDEFESAVRREFSFLERKYGFRLCEVKQDGYVKSMRYASSDVYVILFYGPAAYEPELSFGRIGVDDVPGAMSFHAGDLTISKSSAEVDTPNSQGSKIERIVAGFARWLDEYGSDYLNGDQVVFERMAVRRAENIAAWGKEERIGQQKGKAEPAWKEKHYAEVVALLESMEGELTELERSRLAYARKHCP
jgi:hypothetical protein